MRILPAMCLLAATAQARPQLAATHVTQLGGTDFFADSEFTLPLISGGALACFETSATAFGGGSVTLVRVDEEGTELWRRTDAVASRTGRMDSLQRTPGGSILLCTQDSTSSSFRDGRLLSIDRSGSLEWETWPASATSGPFLGRVAGFSPSGDIYLIGYTRGEDVLSALLIDAATGAELWRVDRPGVADFQFVDSFRGSSAGGDLFVAYDNGSSTSILRIDPAGQVVYEIADLGSGLFGAALKSIHAMDTGDLYVAESSGQFGAGFMSTITRLDGAGAVQWREATAVQSEIVDVQLTADGGVLVGYRRIGGLLRRLDAAGGLVWQRFGQPGVRRLTGFALEPDGVATAAFETSAGPGSVGVQIARYGDDGTLLGTLQLDPTSSAPAVIGASVSAVDARGNSWVTYVSGATAAPESVAIARVVLDEVDESVVCGASTPNSTGALGRLAALGSAVADRNNLTLVAGALPAGQTVLFLNARQGGFTPNPGGSAGDLCLGAPLARYSDDLRTSNAAGRARLVLDLSLTPEGDGATAVLAGETWFWQAWHRDTISGSHLTSAVSVTFQ
ncbi:MAG: hypothetical protein AAFP22_13500 [Planctomycetota bacterium]